MKTYCKKMDISEISFVENVITEFLSERLGQSNVAKFFAYYNGISHTKSRKYIDTNPEYSASTIKKIANDVSLNIKNRTVKEHVISTIPHEPIIKYMEIIDGLSGKVRELGLEKMILQIYEVIAREASEKMFSAKIGTFQVSSIKGRGQSYGKKYIKKWLSNDPEGTKYCVKADVKKCYPSIPHEKVKFLLHRDLGKSDMLVYLYDTIFELYDYVNEQLGRYEQLGKGILIGSPISKDLCNYYISYAYHFITEKLFETSIRRGKEKKVRLISHVMIYADDIVIFGGNKKHLHKAIHQIVAYMKSFLGLEIKSAWRKFLISYKTSNSKIKGSSLDFMGFVFRGLDTYYKYYNGTKKRVKRVKVIIRDKIFLKARRKFYRFQKKICKKIKVSKHDAMSLLAFNGWVKNTDSNVFQEKEMWKAYINMARNIVSRYETGKSYAYEKYYKKWRKLYA